MKTVLMHLCRVTSHGGRKQSGTKQKEIENTYKKGKVKIMTRTERDREFLKEVLANLKESGMRTFICKDTSYCYGFIVTVNGNVLEIEESYGGFKCSLEYVPSHQLGSGCACSESPISNISKKAIEEMERNGLAFARKLGAKLYNGSKYFFNDDRMKRIEEV